MFNPSPIPDTIHTALRQVVLRGILAPMLLLSAELGSLIWPQVVAVRRHAALALLLLPPMGIMGAQAAIAVDIHQHLVSPATARLSNRQPVLARDLIAAMDSARVRRALVLSIAYQFGNPNRAAVANEYEEVKAENDWTAAQAAQYPDRLRAFCGLNPLRDYALDEIARCARDPRMAIGIKLHFGNSDVDLDRPDHVATLKRVFTEANARRMAIVVHMHSSVNQKRRFGAREARVFLEQLLSTAPNVPVQIAHLTGAGGYDDPAVDDALSVFVDAVSRGDVRMRNVYFDVSGVVSLGRSLDKKEIIAARLRQLGVERVLWGSDVFATSKAALLNAHRAFRMLPLTDAEFDTIEHNVPPYMRW
jgi:predicted TIM-barrel fold metal-dependent hydrolase